MLYVAPAAIVALSDPEHGAAVAVGVLPAAILGVPARRRARITIAIIGMLAGVSMLADAVLAATPVLAVTAIFAFGIGAAWLAGHSRAGALAMTLALPLVGISLSCPGAQEGLAICALIATGSIYATAVALLWPERKPAAPRTDAPSPTLEYGVRFGLAAATAAAIGFALGLEHVGWATGAALLVMRPTADMQRLRSVGPASRTSLGRRRPQPHHAPRVPPHLRLAPHGRRLHDQGAHGVHGPRDLQMVNRYVKLLPQPGEDDSADRLNAYLRRAEQA